MFIKLDRYFEEMFKVRLCAENARARIESLRLARATQTRTIFSRTRNIMCGIFAHLGYNKLFELENCQNRGSGEKM